MAEDFLVATDLHKSFGEFKAVDGVTFSIEKGEIFGLLGPNGAGKTTLLHTLLGFHPASEGTASVLGKDIRTESKAIRSMVGYMPENESFVPGINAVRFVRMMAELSGLPPSSAMERAHEALFYVGLGEARYRRMETFSLGMKQRVKLAQALVHDPELLFLDEPTNGLDPRAREEMLELITELPEKRGCSIVLSTHLLPDVDRICDQVLILADGRVRRVDPAPLLQRKELI